MAKHVRRSVLFIPAIFLPVMLLSAVRLSCQEIDLLGSASDWKWTAGRNITGVYDVESFPGAEGRCIKIELVNNGDGKENYPILTRSFPEGTNWEEYKTLVARFYVTAEDTPDPPSRRRVLFVLINRSDTSSKGQQDVRVFPPNENGFVPAGRWVEYRGDISNLKRDNVYSLIPHFYEKSGDNLNRNEKYTWYINELKVVKEQDSAPAAKEAELKDYSLAEGRLQKPKEAQVFPFHVRYLPSYDRIWISEADISGYPKKEQVGWLRVEVRKNSDGAVLSCSELPFQGEKIAGIQIDNAGIREELCEIRGYLLDRQKKILDSSVGRTRMEMTDYTTGRWVSPHTGEIINPGMAWVKPFDIVMTEFGRRKYPFTGNNLGRERTVIPPFEPVRLEGKEIVSVWGRKYQLNILGLPQQIISRQPEPTVGEEYEPLLASGVRLMLYGKKGEQAFRGEDGFKYNQQTDDRIVVNSRGSAGDITVNLKSTIEQDGVIKVEMTVVPVKRAAVKGLALQIPLKEKQAVLMHHLNDTVYPNLKSFKGVIGGHAGYVPAVKRERGVVWDSTESDRKGAVYGNFQPMVWLGNEDRGFTWFADSDKGWILDDKKAALEIIREKDRVILQVNFINKEVELEHPLNIVFGMLATPARPMPELWRGWIFPRWATIDWSFYESLKSLRKIVMIGAGDPAFNAGMMSPLAKDWEQTRSEYANIRSRFGEKNTFMEYWCIDMQTLDLKEFLDYFGEWIVPNPSATFKHQYSGHTKESSIYVHIQRAVPSWLDFRVWCVDKKLKETGLFAFYEDNAKQQFFSDPALGFGYVREDGSSQPEFDFFSFREYMKRVASVYHENNYENLSAVHKSASMMAPCFTFTPIVIDGEQPSRYVTGPTKDFIDLWPDKEYIRAHIMGRQFGFIGLWLSMITAEDTDGRQARALMALILPHDLPIWDGDMKNKGPIRKWHEIKDRFGFASEKTRLYPYWASEKYRVAGTDSEDVLVTVWKAGRKALIMLSNLGEQRKIAVKPDLGKLGLPPEAGLKVEDAETGDSLGFSEKKIILEIKRHDYRIILIESKSA